MGWEFFLILFILFLLLTKLGLALNLKASSREGHHELAGQFHVKWLLFSHTFLFGKPRGKNGEPESRGPRKKKKEKKEKKEKKLRGKLDAGTRAFSALRQPLFRLFSGLLGGLNIRHLDANLSFGLPDPADTGIVCGFLYGLAGAVYSRCRKCRVGIEPLFLEQGLDFRGDAQISIKIYSLIFPIIKFIINRRTVYFTYSILKEKLGAAGKARSQAL